MQHAKKPRWSRPLPQTVKPLDGPAIKTLRDTFDYLNSISEKRQYRRAWQHLATLMLAAAEDDGDVKAVANQLKLALLIDGKLDVKATTALS